MVTEKREILGGWISIYSSYFQWSENDRLTRVQFLSNEYLFNANFVVGRDHQRSCICLQWKMLNTNSLWDSPFTWPSAVECNRPRTVLIDSPKILDICLNKPYSRYWTGTDLQWRLMRANIIKRDWSFASVKSPQFEASSRPLPWMQIWSTAHG